MFVGPATEVYEGMIVGENARSDDMDVNPTKEKKLTNVRSSTGDELERLIPAKNMAWSRRWSSAAATSASRSPRPPSGSARSCCRATSGPVPGPGPRTPDPLASTGSECCTNVCIGRSRDGLFLTGHQIEKSVKIGRSTVQPPALPRRIGSTYHHAPAVGAEREEP